MCENRCIVGFQDKRMQALCEANIQDPDDAKILLKYSQKCDCDKLNENELISKIETIKDNYYILEIFVDKVRLIPIPKVENIEDQLLDAATKKKREEEEERLAEIKANLLVKLKFHNFPIIKMELMEYKDKIVKVKKMEIKEWEPSEEEEDDEISWKKVLKEKMMQIEQEEAEKEEAKKRPPNRDEELKAIEEKRLEGKKYIGKSCLFSMIPSILVRILGSKKLEITLFELGEGKKKSRFVGSLNLPMDDREFVRAIARACHPTFELPVVGTKSGDFEIYSDEENRITSIISLVIRLKCNGYTAVPEKRFVPRLVKRKPNDVETFLINIKSLSAPGIAGTCPLLEDLRKPSADSDED